MRVLIIAIHYPVASGRYAVDALRRLGHDVRSIGPSTGNQIWGMTVDEKYVWIGQEPEDGWEPELVIAMDGNLAVPRLYPCPTVVYGVDSHVRDYRNIADPDHYFLSHKAVCCCPWNDDIMTFVPCGYDPVAFTPGKPWQERELDAACIGVLYGQRAELLYAVLSGIPEVKVAYGTGPIYDQYAAIYQNSRISLVRSSASDVAIRVWESSAMGCLVLMDDCPDCEALGLVDGENCLIYHDTNEAVAKAQWALSNPVEAEQIAATGQVWAQDGTWDKRLQVIIDWAEAQQSGQKTEKAARK